MTWPVAAQEDTPRSKRPRQPREVSHTTRKADDSECMDYGPDGADAVFQDEDPIQDTDERLEGAGFLRGAEVDRAAALCQSALLESSSIRAAAPLRVLCCETSCQAVLQPSDMSCWCRDCRVFRCAPCSENHRHIRSGVFHVADVWNPMLGYKTVQRARIGEESFYLPGFDFCENCGANVISNGFRDVTLVSNIFGVERVHVPSTQTCVISVCGRVHDATDILVGLYEMEKTRCD